MVVEHASHVLVDVVGRRPNRLALGVSPQRGSAQAGDGVAVRALLDDDFGRTPLPGPLQAFPAEEPAFSAGILPQPGPAIRAAEYAAAVRVPSGCGGSPPVRAVLGKRFAHLPGTVRHQRAVAIQVFLEGFAVHLDPRFCYAQAHDRDCPPGGQRAVQNTASPREGKSNMKNRLGWPIVALAGALILLGCVPAHGPSAADQKLAEEAIAKGRSSFDKADFNAAIAAFTEAIRLNPECAGAYTNRGLAYTYSGLLDRAIADLTEAIRLDPTSAIAYSDRGNAYAFKGELDKAIADHNEALRLSPHLAEAYYNRGYTYEQKDELEKAIADYSEAIRFNPNLVAAYYNRGAAYGNMGDADKALADLTEFLRLNPKYAAAYGDRALAHFAKGNHAKAIADLAEAIRIDPKMAEARWGRAVGFLERADDVKAQEDWVQAKMLTFARKGSGGGP